MADVTITATNVEPASTVLDGNTARFTASEQIEAGEVFYVNTSNQAVLASHGTQTGAGGSQGSIVYMAINTAEKSGQEVKGVKLGQVTIGTHSQTVGTAGYVSTNGGKIAPVADIGAADYVTLVGIFDTATTIYVDPIVSGVAHG